MGINKKKCVIDKAWDIQDVLNKEAEDVDKNNEFPSKGLKVLKESDFMSLMIPEAFGGLGQGIRMASKISQILASGCLSTSIIWGMHCQQVMAVVNHAKPNIKNKLLSEIVKKKLYIASVTSENKKGGHLLTAYSPLKWLSKEEFSLNREAPTVTGGAYADAYLITVKKVEKGLNSDVSLVYANREDLKVQQKDKWDSMGMRGTQTVAMVIKGDLNKDTILTEEKFEDVAQITLIPMAHVMWVSGWLGATKSAFEQQVKIMRKHKYTKKYNFDLIIYRLSQVRLLIDTVEVYLNDVIDKYEKAYSKKQIDFLKSNNFNIHLNNLKILGSENLFKAVNELIEISGLYHGYAKNSEISLERIFRDLRAASLMYHNDRLKLANGKLALFDSKLLPVNK
ncbi:acyl-CoA dehydrogenase family protein [Bacillus cereus]